MTIKIGDKLFIRRSGLMEEVVIENITKSPEGSVRIHFINGKGGQENELSSFFKIYIDNAAEQESLQEVVI